MKLNLNKKSSKQLSHHNVIANKATPAIVGGTFNYTDKNFCWSNIEYCAESAHPNACAPSQHVTVCA